MVPIIKIKTAFLFEFICISNIKYTKIRIVIMHIKSNNALLSMYKPIFIFMLPGEISDDTNITFDISILFLKALKNVSDACKKKGIPCSVCGEMASRSLEAFALVALGFTTLSMNPASLPAVKGMIRTMNQEKTSEFILKHLNGSVKSLRPLLTAYATDHNILI